MISTHHAKTKLVKSVFSKVKTVFRTIREFTCIIEEKILKLTSTVPITGLKKQPLVGLRQAIEHILEILDVTRQNPSSAKLMPVRREQKTQTTAKGQPAGEQLE